MNSDPGHLLLMVAGFLAALGALIAILDLIESSLHEPVAARLDNPDIRVALSHDDPAALSERLPEPR